MERTIMNFSRVLLAICLLVSLGCDTDIGPLNLDLGSELLTVNVSTIGENLDPDGYMLSVTGEPDEAIGINATRTYSVFPNNLTVELRGIAGNCTVANNPRTIDVRGSVSTTFIVECA